MFSVFLLWVHPVDDTTTEVFNPPPEQLPEPIEYFNKMTLGYTNAASINHILADRKSNFTKFTRYSRNYKNYMELFREVENNLGKLEVSIKLLRGNIETKEECLREYLRLLREYRFFYGDKCIVPETRKEYNNLLGFLAPPPESVVPSEPEPELSKEERRRISRRKYETKVRERLNQKSRLYYESHKEELKAKRVLAKRNAGN